MRTPLILRPRTSCLLDPYFDHTKRDSNLTQRSCDSNGFNLSTKWWSPNVLSSVRRSPYLHRLALSNPSPTSLSVTVLLLSLKAEPKSGVKSGSWLQLQDESSESQLEEMRCLYHRTLRRWEVQPPPRFTTETLLSGWQLHWWGSSPRVASGNQRTKSLIAACSYYSNIHTTTGESGSMVEETTTPSHAPPSWRFRRRSQKEKTGSDQTFEPKSRLPSHQPVTSLAVSPYRSGAYHPRPQRTHQSTLTTDTERHTYRLMVKAERRGAKNKRD